MNEMPKIAGVALYGARGQTICMLLTALYDLKVARTKREVIDYIIENQWFDIKLEDRSPYPSQPKNGEPRWQTLVAWGRKDCVGNGLMEREGRDCWAASTEGLNTLVRIRERFRRGDLNVRNCYLWKPVLKQLLDPTYQPFVTDAKRPEGMYEDIRREIEIRDFLKDLGLD